MKVCIQRVKWARVEVDQAIVGQIDAGMLVLLGVQSGDEAADLDYVVQKSAGLRIFADNEGKMNLSLNDSGGAMLVVSQFTLMGDCRKGKRPSFIQAAPPEIANAYYQQFVEAIRSKNIPVACGVFQADMQVVLCNDGPVTVIIDSRQRN